MIPQLANTFNVSALGVSSILGTYYYTYSTASLVAGILLDRLGAKYIVPAGMVILGVGCLLFGLPQEGMGYLGRLLQGAGSAFAFTGLCTWPRTACRLSASQPPSESRSAWVCSAARLARSWSVG